MKHKIEAPNTIGRIGAYSFILILAGIDSLAKIDMQVPYLAACIFYVNRHHRYIKNMFEAYGKSAKDLTGYIVAYMVVCVIALGITFYIKYLESSMMESYVITDSAMTTVVIVGLGVLAINIYKAIVLKRTLSDLCYIMSENNIHMNRPNIFYALFFDAFYFHNYLNEIDRLLQDSENSSERDEKEPSNENSEDIESTKAQLEEIEKLFELKERGAITQEEFEKKKRDILGM